MQHWQKIPNASDHLKWYQNKGQLKLNFFLSILAVGLILNGYEGSIIAGLQAFDAWHQDLGNPTPAQIGALNACPQIAGLVVGPIIAYIDEHFGRKWGIRFYGYCLIIGTVIGCVAGLPGTNGYALFIVGRIIIGFGLASFLMTSLIVVQEITHPRSRSTQAHAWNNYYIIGLIIASWVNFGCSYIVGSWGWRIPYIIQLPLAVYILIAVQFVPETPRFLMGKERYEEAFQFLVDYHGNGDREDQLVLFEYEEMKVAITKEREAKAAQWSTILRSPNNRHRLGLASLMIFMVSLSGSSIIYWYYTIIYSQVGITDPTTQTGIQAGLNVLTWFSQIAAVITGRKVGRKTILLWVWPMLLCCLVGMCATSGVYAETGSVNNHAAVGSVVFVWLYLTIFNFANPVLWSYPAEVQTYSMRSKGLLVWNTVNQLFGAYVTWVDAIALNAIGYRYYAVYMPLVIIQWFLAYRYMVETRGYTLEEVALAFDGSSSSLPSDIEAAGYNATEDADTKSRPTDSK